jgi:hypothetical protein
MKMLYLSSLSLKTELRYINNYHMLVGIVQGTIKVCVDVFLCQEGKRK